MLQKMIMIAKEAGRMIEREKWKELDVEVKDDKSLLTRVDMVVNKFVVDALNKEFPAIQILSEEFTPAVDSDAFFVVDPIDGTAEFVANATDRNRTAYSVCIGYIEKNKPKIGVVYQSAIDKLYYAEQGKGAFVAENECERRIFTRRFSDIVIGPINIDDDLKKFVRLRYGKEISEFAQVGAFSVKVCQVAEGCFGRFIHTNFDESKVHASLWDSGAADVILSEAGGRSFEIKTLLPVKYDPKHSSLLNGYIADCNRYDGILIFDVDGVLGDFDELRKLRDVAHIEAVAKKLGISSEEMQIRFHATRNELRKVGKCSTIETMMHFGISKEEFYDIMNSVDVENRIVITKNAKDVLQSIPSNYAIVALTNTPYLATIRTLEHLGLLSFFDKLYCIDTHKSVKPDPQIFRAILSDFKVDSGFSIGDSIEKDLAPAKKVGLKTIYFNPKRKQITEDVDHNITDLMEIKGIIDGN